ncbi:OmpA family protein [Aurantibacillus circumpalustris]|uniref:OmpA family protein n=1 Tax=Aurantibacillus circumpalustris TaxID=3036359 RepID=UPI00295C00BF|nr:OmpA family protein [Aurantibacillus circumpalustris]
MLLKKSILFLCCLFIASVANSQSKKVWIDLADESYAKRDYANAAIYYLKVLDDTTVLRSYVLPYEPQLVNLKMPSLFKVPELEITKKKDSINIVKADLVQSSKYDFILYRLAQSYRLNFDYSHAADAYNKCVERKVYKDAGYYYGISLMHQKKYDVALKAFDSFVAEKEGTDSLILLAARRETWCYFALDTLAPTKANIRMMDTLVFNRGTSNFGTMYYLSDEKVIFTSSRRGGVVTDPEKQDSRYYCDLYYSTLEDTIWQRPINFGRPVNTSLHEGSGVFTPEEVMLFTRWSDNNRYEAFIYMARTTGGKFFEAMKLGTNINMPGYKSHHPFVTADGHRLFFSSNRPGGKGGFDIWMASIDENGFVGDATNLGDEINTPADEVTPFYHDISNTLYFSSNGLPGLGGLDIFKSSLNVDDSIYQVPVNLNRPINSSKDDAYYVTNRLGTKGFLSSDRLDCEGGHCYNIYSYENDPIKFDLEGVVTDETTGLPIPSALVTIRDVHDNDEPFYVVTDEQGYYKTELKANFEYFLKAQKSKYFGKSASVITKGLTDSKHFEENFELIPIPEGDIEIEGVEYDFNKATLRPKSMEVLDKIVDLLKLNDNLSIELSSHTDSRGNDAYNLKLSQARAQSCVDYLIQHGIDKNHLNARGYGESKPIIPQVDIDAMVDKSPEFEAAHQKNRRTAFRIIGETNLNLINATK